MASLAPLPGSLKVNLCATHTEMLQRRKLHRSAAILGAAAPIGAIREEALSYGGALQLQMHVIVSR